MKMENLSNTQNVKLQNVLDQLISLVKYSDHSSFQGCRNGLAVDLSQHCEYDSSPIREVNSITKELEHIGSPDLSEVDDYNLVVKRRNRKARNDQNRPASDLIPARTSEIGNINNGNVIPSYSQVVQNRETFQGNSSNIDNFMLGSGSSNGSSLLASGPLKNKLFFYVGNVAGRFTSTDCLHFCKGQT